MNGRHVTPEPERRRNRAVSDSPGLGALEPATEWAELESTAERFARSGDLHSAVVVWAEILRLRMEAGCPVT